MRGKPLASSVSLTGCLRWSGKTRSGKRLPMTRSGCIDVSSLTHRVSGAKRSSGGAHHTVLWGATQGRRREREMGRGEAQQEEGGVCRQRRTPAAGQVGPIPDSAFARRNYVYKAHAAGACLLVPR